MDKILLIKTAMTCSQTGGMVGGAEGVTIVGMMSGGLVMLLLLLLLLLLLVVVVVVVVVVGGGGGGGRGLWIIWEARRVVRGH